ncbi:uncharacterized protein I206_102221 [Kwoniella pini CBS 10737]|uniref:Uncharacterized protein n=1 Tax=Kwoniella pini CBS 10737 TaxID=1296096 RepID=A0A1B9HSW1_9TREE|nr:uncharacterized protein I206_07589 [Kwoniella pini CBS 10737]OCF46356.1 hypothetical protein I206_07589 [Kwoniella pini CBS 10737]
MTGHFKIPSLPIASVASPALSRSYIDLDAELTRSAVHSAVQNRFDCTEDAEMERVYEPVWDLKEKVQREISEGAKIRSQLLANLSRYPHSKINLTIRCRQFDQLSKTRDQLTIQAVPVFSTQYTYRAMDSEDRVISEIKKPNTVEADKSYDGSLKYRNYMAQAQDSDGNVQSTASVLRQCLKKHNQEKKTAVAK